MNLIMIVALVSYFSSLLPLGLALRKWRGLRIIQLIIILTACSFLFDSIAFYYGRQGINTYPIGNLFFLVQALLLLLVYRESFSWRIRFVYWTGGIYTILFIVNYLVIQSPYAINSYSFTLSCLILIVLSLLYFQFLLKNLPVPFVHRSPMIWINIAVLIYFGGNLFLFMLYNYFVSTIWILHNILNITKNILFFIAIWQSQRKINSTSS